MQIPVSRVAINYESRTSSVTVRRFLDDEYVRTIRLGVRTLAYVYRYMAFLRRCGVVVQLLIDENLTDV